MRLGEHAWLRPDSEASCEIVPDQQRPTIRVTDDTVAWLEGWGVGLTECVDHA